MKLLQYGIWCEDATQKFFIKSFLPLFIQELNKENHLQFVLSQNFKLAATNNKQVDSRFFEACEFGFRINNLDLLFVGRDLDDFTIEKLNRKYDLFLEQIKNQPYKQKVIVFIPIQAIEHWLLYLQHRKNNPRSTKNVSYERTPKDKAKLDVYGRSHPRSEELEEKIEDLINSLDINWLKTRSQSFNHFYKQMEEYIKSFS